MFTIRAFTLVLNDGLYLGFKLRPLPWSWIMVFTLVLNKAPYLGPQ
jgi:hypothetical protein